MDNRIIRNTFYAQLLAYIVASLASTIGHLVDGIVIGRCLGVDSMAAFGVVSPLMVAFALTGAVFSSGARNRFTKLVGGGRIKEAQGVFSLALLMAVGIATLLMLVILPTATPFTRFLGASKNAANLLPKARAYLIGIAFGLPAMNAMRILNAFMPIDNDRNLPVIASIALTVSDIILDLIVVFVLHGDTFEMGLATSISYYIAVAVLLTHFKKKDAILKLSFREIPWKEFRGVVTHGLPMCVCRLGNTIRSTFMNHLLSIIASSAAIAAYSVHRQTDDFLCCLTIGMADTVAMLAGVLYGEEDRPMLKRLLKTSVRATLMLTVGIAALAWFAAPWFASLYIVNDPEALSMSIRAVRAYALGMPFYGLSLIYFNYFQGVEKSKLSSIAGFLSESGFLMLSAGVLSRWWGADAVWNALPVTQVLMFIFYAFVVVFESRRMGIEHSPIMDRVLMLPADFDVKESDRMDKSITQMTEVLDLTGAVWQFCAEHGCDADRQYLMALSVEEMAGNVIQHGFSHDKKPHSIDVRILKKGEDYIVRIRDDCLIFDPVKQVQLFSPDDKIHHIGLRMITSAAKEVRYTCVLKLNNLLIRV